MQQCARPVAGLIHLVFGVISPYYLNKVKCGPCRCSAPCLIQSSVKLRHQTARIIAPKGANVPATFTEHFYNDWKKDGEGGIYSCYIPLSIYMFTHSVGALVLKHCLCSKKQGMLFVLTLAQLLEADKLLQLFLLNTASSLWRQGHMHAPCLPDSLSLCTHTYRTRGLSTHESVPSEKSPAEPHLFRLYHTQI